MENNGCGELYFDGIDTAQGIARFAGKKDRYYKNLRKFAELLESSFPAFERFLSETEAEAAAGDLHNIKGIAGNLGAIQLFELVRAFEVSVKLGAPDSALYTETFNVVKSVTKEILEKTVDI